jgi:hypothetical protein
MLYVVWIRCVELVDQFKQLKQEHSPMRLEEDHGEKDVLQGSLHHATKADAQQPAMDSERRKPYVGVAQAGPGYTPDYTVAAGAWPHIGLYRDVAVHLEATNQYGLHLAAPFMTQWGVNQRCVH